MDKATDKILLPFFWLYNDGLLLVSSRTFSPSVDDIVTRYRGLIMSYGVFFEHYDHKLTPSIPDSQLSLVGGTQSFITLFLSVWVGRLLDRRRHYYVLCVGFGLMIVGLFSLSFVNQLKVDRQKFGIMWFTQGFLTSVGMSCFFMYGLHNTIAVRFL